MKPYNPTDNERDPPVQHRTDMNPNSPPPTVDDFPPMPEVAETLSHTPWFPPLVGDDAGQSRIDAEAERSYGRSGADRTDRGDDGTKREHHIPAEFAQRVILQPFERADQPYYVDASTDDLDIVRQVVCGDPAHRVDSWSEQGYGRALWNEIHRLRSENARYVQRHAEQERAIVTARAERDTARAGNRTVEGEHADKWRESQERTQASLNDITRQYHESQQALTLVTEQRNAARAIIANPVQSDHPNAYVSKDAYNHLCELLRTANSELQARANEGMELAAVRGELNEALRERDAARDALSRTHYPETNESVEHRLTSTLHHEYVQAVLPALIVTAHAAYAEARKIARKKGHTGPKYPTDGQLHLQIVHEARAIATEAMKQAQEAT